MSETVEGTDKELENFKLRGGFYFFQNMVLFLIFFFLLQVALVGFQKSMEGKYCFQMRQESRQAGIAN